MSTTKKKIAEQVMFLIRRSDPRVASGIDIRDLMELVGQTINRLLKAEYYGPHLQSGEAAAAGMMMATYEGIAVVKSGKYSKITLPCMPIKLFKNQGLYEITDNDDLMGFNRFIPVPVGMPASLAKGMSITSDVLGKIYYLNTNLDVIFSRDIVTIDEITSVRVKLVVADVNSLDESDPLPVHADMESDIIREVLSFYGVQPVERTVDISAEKVKQ